MKNIIILIIIFAALFFLYRSCTKGYDKYVYLVQVNDETVFGTILSENDTRIIGHGRKLKKDIILLDQEIDKGNGRNQGIVRWYNCMGIDCDEGWQRSFSSEK